MPMDTGPARIDARRFVGRAVVTSLGLALASRLAWIETVLVLPATRVQGALASAVFGAPAAPLNLTLACSGTDAMALCLGAILCYPVAWRTRAFGAALGGALIVGLNIARIGTLGRAAGSPGLFAFLHLHAWPAVLVLAIAGYVFGWMRLADRGRPASDPAERTAQPSRRFVGLTIAFLLLFTAAAPLYLESPAVLSAAGGIARTAAWILGAAGVPVHAAGNILWTPRGGFVVTQECVSTPLIAVYLAAVCSYAPAWRGRLTGVMATVPLFFGLGVARLLVLAVPAAMGSPLFLVHAFYQLAAAVVVLFVAALWRYGHRAAPARALAGVVAAALFVWFAGPFYTRVFVHPAVMPVRDPQGALALLPEFQVGLYLALWVAAFVAVGWRRFAAGLALLWLTQAAGLVALQALDSREGLVAAVRGWAIAGPVLIFSLVIHAGRARR